MPTYSSRRAADECFEGVLELRWSKVRGTAMPEGVDQDDFIVAGPSSGDITEGCSVVGYPMKHIDASL